MERLIFCTGMFRSGTTFLARLFNAIPTISAASDPLRPLVNQIRTERLRRLNVTVPSTYPLDDYFNSPTNLLEALTLSPAPDIIETNEYAHLKHNIVQRSYQFSQLFSQRLSASTRTFSSYRQLFFYLLDIVRKSYPSSRQSTAYPSITCFKEVWSIEFAFTLLEWIPDIKIVYIYRDIRSIVASNRRMGGNYPLLFLARQWRKQNLIAHYLHSRYPSNVLLVKFEDFFDDTDRSIYELLSKLSIPVTPYDLDHLDLRDGKNQTWTQNSSFRSVNDPQPPSALQYLDQPTLNTINYLCFDQLMSLGYQLDSFSPESFDLLSSYPATPQHLMSEWIRPFTTDLSSDLPSSLEMEVSRLSTVLKSSSPPLDFLHRLSQHIWI